MKNIKKMLALLLAMIMTFSLVACGGGSGAGNNEDVSKPTPTPEQKVQLDTTMLQSAMTDTEDFMAIAFLGYVEEDFADFDEYFDSKGFKDQFHPFVYDIDKDHFVQAEGDELYCIVPRYEDDTVTISEWIVDEYNDWQGEEGNVLYHAKNDGHPILVKCNISDLVPNILITIENSNGYKNYFVPYISAMDGYLETYLDDEYSFCDFTPYDLIVPGWDGWDDGGDYWGDDWNDNEDYNAFDIVYLSGDWTSTVYTKDDEYLDAGFMFDGSGNVEFAYGPSGDVYQLYYSGSYYLAEDPSLPENAVILELYLTENNTDTYPVESIYTVVTFEMYPYMDTFGMTYETGDLLFGNEYDTYYELSPSVG